MKYSNELKVKEARQLYYRENGIAQDGGASEKIGRADFGPITIYVPNFPARVAALQRHDLHHILLDADTSMRGEAIVGGFETGTGCGHFWVSWFLAPQTIVYGLFLNPKQTFGSYLLGRRSKNFFKGPFRNEWLEMTVGEIRDVFLAKDPINAAPIDLLTFLIWVFVGTLGLIVSFFMLLSPIIITALLLRS